MSKTKREFNIELKGALENGVHRCEWPDCDAEGEHRAPRSRQQLKSYRWFCLEHVRAYNKSWNYYEGMTEQEVETDRRKDNVGRRPSWPLGSGKLAYAFDPKAAFNDFGGFNDNNAKPRQGRTEQEKAMAALDLLPPVTPHAVKARYKELVKRHHPDANGGDKVCEEKFKQISNAYEIIMAYMEN